MSDSATPWTVAYQAPPCMGFSRQEYWSALPFPSPGDLLHPGIEPGSPALQADALPSEPPGKKVQIKSTGAELLETWGGEGRGPWEEPRDQVSLQVTDLTLPLRAGAGLVRVGAVCVRETLRRALQLVWRQPGTGWGPGGHRFTAHCPPLSYSRAG